MALDLDRYAHDADKILYRRDLLKSVIDRGSTLVPEREEELKELILFITEAIREKVEREVKEQKKISPLQTLVGRYEELRDKKNRTIKDRVEFQSLESILWNVVGMAQYSGTLQEEVSQSPHIPTLPHTVDFPANNTLPVMQVNVYLGDLMKDEEK